MFLCGEWSPWIALLVRSFCFSYWTVFMSTHEFPHFYLPVLSLIPPETVWASSCMGLGLNHDTSLVNKTELVRSSPPQHLEGATFFYISKLWQTRTVRYTRALKLHFKGLIFFKILWTHRALKVIPEHQPDGWRVQFHWVFWNTFLHYNPFWIARPCLPSSCQGFLHAIHF